MKTFIFLALVATALANSCPADSTYNSIMDRCYKFVNNAVAYQEAQEFCLGSGGLLVSIINATDNFFIAEDAKQLLAPRPSYWIGLDNLSGRWKWSDGRGISYQNWANGQPTNTTGCAIASSGTGVWTNGPCTTSLPFICSYIANPTTTAAPTPTPGPKCLPDQFYNNLTNACYYVGSGAPFWSAESMCVALGGHLTSIHDVHENTFVQGLTSIGGTQKADQMTWIGLHYTGEDWLWTDGSEVDYRHWEPGMPSSSNSDQCVELLQDEYSKKKNVKGCWNNQPCKWSMRKYVCKVPTLW